MSMFSSSTYIRDRLKAVRTSATDLTEAIQTMFYRQGLDFVPKKRGKRLLKLDGFSPLTRRLIFVAYALLALMAFWLIFLLLATDVGAPKRPPSPAAALAVFVAFSVAWGLLLTGALYARRFVRVLAIFVYLIVTASWVVSFIGFLPVYTGKSVLFLLSILLVLVGAVLLLTVPGFFFLRRRAQPAPVPDFAILSLLIFLTYTTVFLQLVLIPSWVGDQLWINVSGFTLAPLLALIELLFIILGLDIVELLYRSTGLVTVVVGSQLRRRLLGGLVVLLISCQVILSVWEHVKGIGEDPLWKEAVGDVAALGFPCIAFIAWWLLQRRGSASSEPLTVDQVFKVVKQWALLIIAVFWGSGLAGVILLVILSLVLPFISADLLSGYGRVINNYFTAILGVWFFITAALAIVMGILVARRGHRAVALYLIVLGGSTLLFLSMNAVGILAGGAAVGFWWAVIFGIVGLYWCWRGQLTIERLRRLLLLSLITLALYGLGKYYVPAAGADTEVAKISLTFVVFTALGLLWDLLTVGYWANASSSGLPQISRIFLYLGFVIVCITSLDWSVMALGLSEISSVTKIMAPFGLVLLGRPLIFATFVIMLTMPATTTQIEGSSVASTADQVS